MFLDLRPSKGYLRLKSVFTPCGAAMNLFVGRVEGELASMSREMSAQLFHSIFQWIKQGFDDRNDDF